jgi:hypothetical protein
MPHRRPAKKGSFGGHFDELVPHFPDERPPPPSDDDDSDRDDDCNVHDRLFERAWRKPRDEQRNNPSP